MRRPSPRPAVPPVPETALSFRWLWYALSLFIPFAGILIALFLYDQDPREVRRVGRACLLISFLVWVVFPVIVLFFFLLLAFLMVLGWLAEMMPTD
jgi:hypothetical protein